MFECEDKSMLVEKQRVGRVERIKTDFCSANLNRHEQHKTAFIKTDETDAAITEIWSY